MFIKLTAVETMLPTRKGETNAVLVNAERIVAIYPIATNHDGYQAGARSFCYLAGEQTAISINETIEELAARLNAV